jgi:hypothetical protein
LLLLVWITYNLFKERKTRRKKFFHENVLIKSVHIKVRSDWKRAQFQIKNYTSVLRSNLRCRLTLEETQNVIFTLDSSF